MRKLTLVVGIIGLCLSLTITAIFAQEEAATTNLKEERSTDKQALKEQHVTIRENAQAARQEEKQLRDQIRAAMQAGDKEAAKSLQGQLRQMHQENVAQRRQNTEALKAGQKDLRKDHRDLRDDRRDLRQDIGDRRGAGVEAEKGQGGGGEKRR
jgi:regulatory protein YycI of two-component signal transduction system YycFG